MILKGLLHVGKRLRGAGVSCGVSRILNSRHCFVQIRHCEMGVAPRHLQTFVAEQFRNVPQRDSVLTKTASVGMPEIMPSKIWNLRPADGIDKPMGIDVEGLAGGISYHATRPVPSGAEDHQSAHRILVQKGHILLRRFWSWESWRPAP